MSGRATPRRIFTLLVLLGGCVKDRPASEERATAVGSSVELGGARITMPAADAGRFPVTTAAVRNFEVALVAPARAVAAVMAAKDLEQPLVLFETQELSQLFSDFNKNRAAFQRADAQRKRLAELAKRDAVSGKDVLDSETDLRQAEASLRDAEAKLRQIGFDPALLASMPAGTLLVVADVPEARIGAVDMGERGTFEFSAYPGEKFYGKVARIADAVDPQTRAIHVAIRLDGQGNRLKPGMFARVSIEERTERSLVIPLGCVLSVEGRTFVFVRTAPTRFERREVNLGLDNGTDVQVRSGVVAGEAVVSGNVILLKGLSFGY